jgi:hypothetical protein
LSEIKELLLALSEKVDRLEQKLLDMDNRMSASLNNSNEIKFVKAIIIFID